MSKELFDVANQRAAEIAVSYSHTRPNASDCSSIFPKSTVGGFGILSGENITAGYTTAEDAMNAWMGSYWHKANILQSSFKAVGVGCFYHNGTYYWTQCFLNDGTSMIDYPNNETKQVTISVTPNALTYSIYSSGNVKFLSGSSERCGDQKNQIRSE